MSNAIGASGETSFSTLTYHCSIGIAPSVFGRELVALAEEVGGVAVGLDRAEAALVVVDADTAQVSASTTAGSSSCAVRPSSLIRSTPFAFAHSGRNSGSLESKPMTDQLAALLPSSGLGWPR